MKKLSVLLMLAALTLCGGCARHYVMKMSNGARITTVGKPKLKAGKYYFKDASGRENWVSQGRVTEIAPASMVKEEKPAFIPSVR